MDREVEKAAAEEGRCLGRREERTHDERPDTPRVFLGEPDGPRQRLGRDHPEQKGIDDIATSISSAPTRAICAKERKDGHETPRT